MNILNEYIIPQLLSPCPLDFSKIGQFFQFNSYIGYFVTGPGIKFSTHNVSVGFLGNYLCKLLRLLKLTPPVEK